MNQDTYEQTYQEEISLRELIEILLKSWKMIIILPLILGIATYAYSKNFVEPIYESESIIQVHPVEINTGSQSTNTVDSILNAQSLTSQLSVESYVKQITSPEVLTQAIKTLNLEETYNYEQFRKKITVESIKNSSLITIRASDSTAELAAKIVNTVSDTFMTYITNKQVEQLDSSTELLGSQLTVEKEKLDTVLVKVKEFTSQDRNLDTVSQELSINTVLLEQTKSQLIDLEDTYKKQKFSLEEDIVISKSKIDQYALLLGGIDQTFTLDKTIYDAPETTAIAISEKTTLTEQTDYIVSSNELNPVYISTLETLNTEKINLINLESELSKLTKMFNYNHTTLTQTTSNIETILSGLKSEKSELDYQNNLLQQELSIAETTYNAFNNKLESARVAKAANISETTAILMSEGIVPSNKVGPNNMLNTAIALVLGGMIAVFIAFFRFYWKNSATK